MAYEEIKDRVLVASGVTTYDVSLGLAYAEAQRYVITQIQKYEPSFPSISGGTYLDDVSNDIAAGIFKRRQNPGDMDDGWWGQGREKLNQYIFSVYDVTSDPRQQLTDSQKALLDAQAGLVTSQEAKVEAETLNVPKVGSQIDAATSLTSAQETKLAGVDTSKVTSEIALIDAQTAKIQAETAAALAAAQATLMASQAAKLDADALLVAAQVSKIDAETVLLDNENTIYTHSGFYFTTTSGMVLSN